MAKFERKPATVQAIRYMANPAEVADLAGTNAWNENLWEGSFRLYLPSGGSLVFNLGDWLVRYSDQRLEVIEDRVMDRDFDRLD